MLTGKTKKQTNKYNNKPFWRNPATGQCYLSGTTLSLLQRRNLQHWSSILEFQIYSKLCERFEPALINRQQKLLILPKDDIFPRLTWDIDFVITAPIPLFIEAKGRWITSDKGAMGDFCKMLRFLQQSSPLIFENLTIISDKRWKIGTTNLWTTPISKIHQL